MKNNRRVKKEIKVTYISSPVKVKASASNFRALVQELTGQDSNVAEIDKFNMPLEVNGGSDHEKEQKGNSITQQWIVDAPQGCLHSETATNLFEHEYYSEFLSRSLVEQSNQHLQYDLLSFDMS
ncbi:sigma factor binding protein 1, chloroplastic-like [Lotus japonicus]|uniref:sigma factor binding protein 1, chloroplastic-like n=1 Tax=Lotus japonicus TaxID=34305 RepID=UPI00258FB9E5|nr:sigma factor binding protein 1, chloroplastic-like [Lotus japonicus]